MHCNSSNSPFRIQKCYFQKGFVVCVSRVELLILLTSRGIWRLCGSCAVCRLAGSGCFQSQMSPHHVQSPSSPRDALHLMSMFGPADIGGPVVLPRPAWRGTGFMSAFIHGISIRDVYSSWGRIYNGFSLFSFLWQWYFVAIETKTSFVTQA